MLSKVISHCGVGCTPADIGAEWLAYSAGLAIAGKALYADFLLDFAFAWMLAPSGTPLGVGDLIASDRRLDPD